MLIEHLKDMLLNVFFIFVLFFIYYTFINERFTQISNQLLLFFVSSILIILCMTFPIATPSGYLIDLRQVPFIIGALYGGRKLAFILYFVLISYRFFLDSTGFIEVVIVNAFLLGTLLFIIPFFHRREGLQRKVIIAFSISTLGILYLVVVYFVHFTLRPVDSDVYYAVFIALLYLIQCLTIIFFVYYIEKSRYEKMISEELKRLEKINTVSEIAASISHEVRNPLTITRGFIQLLRDERVTKEKNNLYIDHSLRELDRASSIITDYLSFAKPSLEDMKVLDFKKELAYVLNLARPYAMFNNVEIMLQQSEDEMKVRGEAQKLHQCLINLIKNSIEAMPDGGEIYIELYLEEDVKISIRDTGKGMNAEEISRLGTPYYTTKNNGTGLGMMVVYSIVNTLKGSITVESEVGKGTCFIISFLSE